MTKLFEKYNSLLKSKKTLSETDIISLKSRISTNPCSLTQSEVEKLKTKVLYSFSQCEYNIEESHAQKGLDYLKLKCFKLNGQRRNTKQTRNMPREFFDAIRDFESFTFVGFTCIDYNMMTTFYMPVWRIYTKAGEHFDYHMNQNLEFTPLNYNIESKLNLVTSEVNHV